MTREFSLIMLLISISAMLALSGCSINNKVQSASADQPVEESIEKHDTQEEVLPEYVEINITAVGDVMVHGPQLKAQFNKENNAHDFRNNFQHIKSHINKADLALCNLETTFSGEDKQYSGYPKFNAPDSLGDALKDAGFDVVVTANNHSIDLGTHGVDRTLSVLKNLGLQPVGTKADTAEDNFIITEVKGVKVGIIAYTYETPKYHGKRTINALVIPQEVEDRINTFSYDDLDIQLSLMKTEIDNMKSRGAEVLIFYMHWGNEYHIKPNEYQKNIAQALCEYGVDIIFGSHPHVVQPIEILKSQDNNNTTLVAYSMGNILSNQRYEILKKRHTEDGIIVNATIKKNFKTNAINLEKVTFIPTWVHKYKHQGKNVYEIIPLHQGVNQDLFKLSTNNLWRAENSKNNTLEIVDSEVNNETNIPIAMENSAPL